MDPAARSRARPAASVGGMFPPPGCSGKERRTGWRGCQAICSPASRGFENSALSRPPTDPFEPDFLKVTLDIFLWMQNLVKEMEMEAIFHPVHALRTEVIVGWLERQLQLLIPSWVGSRSCPSPQCVPLDEKNGQVQEINLTWNVASRNGATWDSLGPSRTATGSTSCLTGTS